MPNKAKHQLVVSSSDRFNPNQLMGSVSLFNPDGTPHKTVQATGTFNKLFGPITQAEYDSLTPDETTLYVVIG